MDATGGAVLPRSTMAMALTHRERRLMRVLAGSPQALWPDRLRAAGIDARESRRLLVAIIAREPAIEPAMLLELHRRRLRRLHPGDVRCFDPRCCPRDEGE